VTEAPEKPRVQIVEEAHETLTLLDQDRMSRLRKLAQEAEPLSEGHEVRFHERHVLPRHPMDVEEIRDRVDALRVTRRLPPEATPLPPPEPVALPAPLRADHRAALASVVRGEIVSVEVVYRAGLGDVVEATIERSGAREKRLYVIQDGAARPADQIEDAIDALPTPTAPAAEEPSPAASPPAPKPSRFSLGGKKEKTPKEKPSSAPPSEEKPKKWFGFGKK
jgi:hypothetical protein